MTLSHLTNQELIQEFQNRIQNKTLVAEVVANEFQAITKVNIEFQDPPNNQIELDFNPQ